MIRQTILLLALALCGPARAVPHSPLHTHEFEQQRRVLNVSESARSVRSTFQEWLLGRCSTDQARQLMQAGRRRLTASRASLLQGSGKEHRPWMSGWLDQELSEVDNLLQALKQPGKKLDTRALSNRWSSSLRYQGDWIRDRQRELPQLLAQARHPRLQSYYQWKASLLDLLAREQQLAEALLAAFQREQPPDISWLRYALSLHEEVARIRPPQDCLKAHQLYEKRAAALARLTQSTRDQLSDPSADSGSNLQQDERTFSDLHLEAEKAGLQVLGSLLR